MDNRYSPTTTASKKILRAMFYVGSIGGLLTVFAGGLWIVWNSWITSNVSSCQSLSYLESIGLCSIAYVLYSGIRFAQMEDCSEEKSSTERHTTTENNTPTIPTQHIAPPPIQPPASPLQDLTPEQRKMLLRELDRCCGKPYDCQDSTDIVNEESASH